MQENFRNFSIINPKGYEVIYKSNSLDETKKIAENFAKNIMPKQAIYLSGNLGSGKTTFTNYLAKCFDISERITSPSFTIVKEYQVNSNKHQIDKLVHIDIYRLITSGLNTDQILEELAIAGVDFKETQSLFIIEWGETLKTKIGLEFWLIEISD